MRALRKGSVLAVVVLLAVLLTLVLASVASAYPGLNSSTEKQVAPGLTLRNVYGTCQTFLYQLPHNVTHNGYIHVELTYKPGDYDTYLYLVDSYGQIVAQADYFSTEPQGYMGSWRGREKIDFYVAGVANQDPSADNTDLVGDVYYVMVNAFDDVSDFQLRGYYPRISYSSGEGADNSVDGTYNWYRGNIRYPMDLTAWQRIHGAPYLSAYDFTPTSEGFSYTQLRYPFDAKTKQPLPEYLDLTKQVANFDQYVYPSDWSGDAAVYDYDWSKSSHWADSSNHGSPPADVPMTPDETWKRCLSVRFPITDGTAKAPGKVLHYVPVLWEVSSNPADRRNSPPKAGMSTIGYLASMLYPQNLYLNKSATRVTKGSVILKGNLALQANWDDPAGDTALNWAPKGATFAIQRRDGWTSSWKKVGTAQVGDNGAWAARVAYVAKAKYRGFWQGAAMKSTTVQTRTKVETAPGSGVYEWAGWQSIELKYVNQALFSSGFDVYVAALDKTTGVTLATTSETVGAPTPELWPGTTLKQGDPVYEVTFDGKQPLQIKVVSVKLFSEKSLVVVP